MKCVHGISMRHSCSECMASNAQPNYKDDHARLEQECKDAKCQAELMQRAAEAIREERDAALKQVEGLELALCMISSEIEGNIEPTIRDLVNRVSGINNGADPNDLYDYCERMQSVIDAALSAKPTESQNKTGCGAKLSPGQYWIFCGETDMGQSMPALCEKCGGSLKAECP